MAYSYGIPDGTYAGKPTTASCYEKDGRLMLDVRFMVKDPATGEWYKNERGYDWEVLKRHWLTSAQGAFNEKTVAGLREWAKGWDPKSLDDFWWFQSADANGVPFGNLAAVGEVELNFTTDANGNQSIFVHDPNRPRAAGRKAYVPDGASADKSALAAKWGTRAKALFAATPKKMATPAASAPKDAPAGVPAQGGVAAPARPAAAVVTPSRPAPAAQGDGAKPWAEFPQTPDGAFDYFRSLLGEPYSSAKHDEKWFAVFDAATAGKDPDQLGAADVQGLFEAVRSAMAK